MCLITDFDFICIDFKITTYFLTFLIAFNGTSLYKCRMPKNKIYIQKVN